MYLKRILFLMLVFLIAGCGESTDTGESTGVPPVANEPADTQGDLNESEDSGALDLLFDLSVHTDSYPYQLDIDVRNDGDELAELEMGSGQKYEIIVTDSSGAQVYRYSDDKMFTQALELIPLEPNETISWSEELLLSAGTFAVEVIVMTTGHDYVQQTQFEAVYENEAFRSIQVVKTDDGWLLEGESSVFEATVSYAVGDGHNYFVEDFVTASEGGPGWGSFEINISFEHSDGSRPLTVELYEESAKDGSRTKELAIPLGIY